ncbi:MAG TPA: hypothetical protein VER08_04340 [Pyrinomonadaceae bacterium]|nr:hypothetical protein [Pyrinomonadaceae bacterium]
MLAPSRRVVGNIEMMTRLETRLRECGVYALPDGTRVVACSGGGERPALFYLTDWKLFGGEELCGAPRSSAFRILEAGPDGLIRRLGRPTDWQLADLEDTGRTAA